MIQIGGNRCASFALRVTPYGLYPVSIKSDAARMKIA
jgi:hypothetical protein